MARKVPRKKASRPEEGRDDLSVLHPNADIVVGGRDITVREYGLVEGIRVRAQLQGFTRGLMVVFEAGEALTEDVMDLVAEHFDEVRLAIAVSISPADASQAAIDESAAWIATLGDGDGDLLLNTWWGVCGPFFVRQILRRLLERLRRKAPAGPTSTSASPAPGSAPTKPSGDTPSGN